MNPFENRVPNLTGPARDIRPITPNDSADLPVVAVALYVETGGSVALITETGEARTVQVADYALLPVGARRIRATGTTASGIHALTLV